MQVSAAPCLNPSDSNVLVAPDFQTVRSWTPCSGEFYTSQKRLKRPGLSSCLHTFNLFPELHLALIAEKIHILLPVIAVWRLMKKICSRSVRRRKMHGFTILQKENIDQHAALMRLFGLKCDR